ncbi:MAG: ErpA-related iron-sulfur cluster insertion protein [Desulfovibrio sp.]|jgi:Fe-S cluster assembly iron-binding protein IscA|nr:ErpA-related iron-sulfur cluster insertion protein [Desulfovibrio sp.]
MNIAITSDAAEKLETLLKEEGKQAVVRIRETKVGSACKSKIVLRLSIDEREDEDREGEANSLPFVISEELAEQYGENFSVSLDENKMPVVEAAQ